MKSLSCLGVMMERCESPAVCRQWLVQRRLQERGIPRFLITHIKVGDWVHESWSTPSFTLHWKTQLDFSQSHFLSFSGCSKVRAQVRTLSSRSGFSQGRLLPSNALNNSKNKNTDSQNSERLKIFSELILAHRRNPMYSCLLFTQADLLF